MGVLLNVNKTQPMCVTGQQPQAHALFTCTVILSKRVLGRRRGEDLLNKVVE